MSCVCKFVSLIHHYLVDLIFFNLRCSTGNLSAVDDIGLGEEIDIKGEILPPSSYVPKVSDGISVFLNFDSNYIKAHLSMSSGSVVSIEHEFNILRHISCLYPILLVGSIFFPLFYQSTV